jgi:hypothetical protein
MKFSNPISLTSDAWKNLFISGTTQLRLNVEHGVHVMHGWQVEHRACRASEDLHLGFSESTNNVDPEQRKQAAQEPNFSQQNIITIEANRHNLVSLQPKTSHGASEHTFASLNTVQYVEDVLFHCNCCAGRGRHESFRNSLFPNAATVISATKHFVNEYV